MRLHRLDVCAFGPFPGSVAVDFDDVCSAGLFLIHGATGSGKTSLLDAICFALFADVPGARTKKGLASHHAAEGTRPLVTLDFTSSGRRFRIERSPEFFRPKKRGSGLLRVNAAVALEERRAGGWMPVSTRHDEVAHLLDDVLGMGLAQFAKVVVLPQGDVSAFLRSSPEDRRALLERLFDISTYTEVETWFAEERRRTGSEVENALIGITHELGRLDDLVSAPDEPPWITLPLEEVPAALDSATTELSHEVSELLAAADAAEGACSVAAAALHEARTVAALRGRGLQARDVQSSGQERATEIDRLREQVRRAAAAAAAAGHLAGLDAAVVEQSSTAKVVTAQRSRLSGLVSHDTSSGDLASLLERLNAAAPLLSELTHAQTECSRSGAAQLSAKSALLAADRSARAAADEAQDARESRVLTQAEVERLNSVAVEHPAAEAAHTHAVRMLRLAQQVTELTRAREEAAAALVDANASLLMAQTTLLSLRELQLEGMAGALAARLVEGEACPVCGSDEHPAPVSGGVVVTAEELQHAEDEHDSALAVAHELTRSDAAVAGRIATLLEQLADLGDGAGDPAPDMADSGPIDLVALLARTEHTASVLAETTRARGDLAAAEASDVQAAALVAAAEQKEQDASRARAVADAALETATASHREQVGRVSNLLLQHQQECGCAEDQGAETDPDVERIVANHQALSDQIERVLGAERAHADAVSRRDDREATAVLAALERGFTTLVAARDARMSQREVDSQLARIADHDQALAIAAATLAEDDVAQALALPEPDVDAAAETDASARRAVREAQAAHSATESRLKVLDAVRRDVTDRIEHLVVLRRRATTVKELADAVGGTGGGNELRMRLSSFVLAARLEKVVALANERLQTMDAGRYLLEHSDAKVAGGARSGLDLRVLDQWTGRTRETASLSGGESFMVSLALALGLADAVREESGGFDLGTLFVDEGFGSLDDDSLEQVMSVLDGLREGGRAVGVVSHVADLRSRITHQVVVQKSTSGSEVRVQISA